MGYIHTPQDKCAQSYKANGYTDILKYINIYICMQKYVCIDQHLCDNHKGQRSCRRNVAAQHKGANRSSDPGDSGWPERPGAKTLLISVLDI